MVCKAIIFDYIGTLVTPVNYNMDDSMAKLHSALKAEGFEVSKEKFLESYKVSHEKYRLVRYGQLREVTNAVWVSEALNNLGFCTKVDNIKIKSALNVFFKDFMDTFELREDAKILLKLASERSKIALISNFTYAPVIYCSLRQLRIKQFFKVVVVSNECGWRKPSQNIFKEALSKLCVNPQETVFVGDSPSEDIKGAMEAGLKTVFIESQFNRLADLEASGLKPDFVFKDLTEFCRNFSQVCDSF
jgi:FMN phosphatase YigB (HAD superfamily)